MRFNQRTKHPNTQGIQQRGDKPEKPLNDESYDEEIWCPLILWEAFYDFFYKLIHSSSESSHCPVIKLSILVEVVFSRMCTPRVNEWFDEYENDVNHMLCALQPLHLNPTEHL